MELKIETFARKTFYVKGVEVTHENMQQVAKWCGGSVRTNKREIDDHHNTVDEKYIKVKVHRPLTDRQTMAFVGDYVLRGESDGSNFKVYNPKAFRTAFEHVAGVYRDNMTQGAKRKE